jgi:hypothetical protein
MPVDHSAFPSCERREDLAETFQGISSMINVKNKECHRHERSSEMAEGSHKPEKVTKQYYHTAITNGIQYGSFFSSDIRAQSHHC